MSFKKHISAAVSAGTELQPPSLDVWGSALREAIGRVGPPLGLPPCTVLGIMRSVPAGLTGMGVALEGHNGRVRHVLLGVLSNDAGRTAVARAILGMSPAATPSERDQDDALGEMANVVSGQVKAAMHSIDTSMRLGLPQPLRGDRVARLGETLVLRVSFGTTPAGLLAAIER